MLTQVRDEVQTLTENLERESNLRKEADAENKKLRLKFEQKSKQMELIKGQLIKQVEDNRRMKAFVDQMKQDGSVLSQISEINENLRRKY